MPVHTLPIHDDGTFKFSPPTSSVPHETEPHEDSILSVASLDNEMSPDAPSVSDSSSVSTSAQPDPPLRSVRPRQPPSYLKHYHCPTPPHVANLIQSDSKICNTTSQRKNVQDPVPYRLEIHLEGAFDWLQITYNYDKLDITFLEIQKRIPYESLTDN
ncbi:hypothetical protein LWI29_037493 [Acer saccharum]|uniref:Uncharacterized protein n=1 Tax=Acer saccharum TaxID=4024 RepID=A0AA39S1Y9_ACESA|nr:hypothetical protein LWI29_037493 [Acer saccharum]